MRTFADLNLGLAYLDDGELVKAADSLREAVSQGNASENELAGLMATSHLAAVLILQGRLHEAAELCRQTIREQLARHGKPPPTCCMIYLRLAWVLAEWNDIDGFFANLSQAVILADQIGYDAVVKVGSLSMAWEKQLLAEQGRSSSSLRTWPRSSSGSWPSKPTPAVRRARQRATPTSRPSSLRTQRSTWQTTPILKSGRGTATMPGPENWREEGREARGAGPAGADL